MEKTDVLLDSKSSRTPSQPTRIFMAAVGLLLLGHSLWKLQSGLEANFFSQGFVGLACFLASGWKRTLVLTREGVARTSVTWGKTRTETLPWKEIVHVALAFRKNEMLAMFDRGQLTGLKVLLDQEQEESLRAVLRQCAPHAEISVIGKSR